MHRALRPGGDVLALETLLACGGRVDAVDEAGRTALYVAAAEGQSDVVRWLLANGADPLLRAGDGRTALHAAAANGHGGVAELLLAAAGPRGATSLIQAPDAQQRTAAELAHVGRHLDVVRVIISQHRAMEVRPAEVVVERRTAPKSWRSTPIQVSNPPETGSPRSAA